MYSGVPDVAAATAGVGAGTATAGEVEAAGGTATTAAVEVTGAGVVSAASLETEIKRSPNETNMKNPSAGFSFFLCICSLHDFFLKRFATFLPSLCIYNYDSRHIARGHETWFNAFEHLRVMPTLIQIIFAIVIFGMTAACQKDSINTYRVPKEMPSAPGAAQTSEFPAGHPSIGDGNTMGATSMPREISWKVPEGWQEQAPSEMRVGSFLIKGDKGQQVDMSVVPLSGEAGGDLSNINRWRGQISLGPITEADLPGQSQKITPGGRAMLLVDFANQSKRLMAAIYHREGRTWFFKMMGDETTVTAAKPKFMQFLKTIKFNDN